MSAHIPALKNRFLTRYYDPVVRVFTREAAFKGALVRQVKLLSTDRVFDVGCGTGTLASALAKAYPDATIMVLSR